MTVRVLGSRTRPHDHREQNATCVTIERDLLPNMVGQHRSSHSEFFTGCPRLATCATREEVRAHPS